MHFRMKNAFYLRDALTKACLSNACSEPSQNFWPQIKFLIVVCEGNSEPVTHPCCQLKHNLSHRIEQKETRMTETAKIVRFHKAGGPEVLQVEELPMPEPAAGEVRLRVKAIGLNRAEVMFRNNQYLYQPSFPSKLGYEASGVVEAVGPGVDPNLIGKTMSSVPAFAANAYGVYGEVAILPVGALAAYPSKLSYAEGTSIWMQYITAYGALVHHGHLTEGDYVLITAASSSVGIAAIEIAKAEGAVSIATTRTSKKKAELLSVGADHVVVTEEEDLVTRVKEITQ